MDALFGYEDFEPLNTPGGVENGRHGGGKGVQDEKKGGKVSPEGEEEESVRS